MKKVMLYIATAVLLGTVTMVAPLWLLKPSYYGLMVSSRGGANARWPPPEFLCALDEGETTFEGGALKRAVSPSNLRSTGLILIPSLLLALGVSLYLKKRIF